MSDCFLCKTELMSSYFLRLEKFVSSAFNNGMLVEVCPECHHHFIYDPADLRQNYIDKKKINMRGLKYGRN